ncbi:MAG: cytochrome P450 [Ilumatobacteraceae bacterium]|nr:cytochrome P450 [Acidimicrobiales bacterium]MCB9396070.1 cytochrome P450 [Acidimicrobiaceae bacterium]
MTLVDPQQQERLVVDLLDPDLYQRNPHDVWTWMRANEPVYRDHRNGLWGVTRHTDLKEVERVSSIYLSGQGYRAIWAPDEINMIAQDDPRHRQQRMLVQPYLTGASVASRHADTAALVAELVAGFGGDDVEVVESFAAQLPARLTARLLGYPESMWPQLKSWSERLMRVDMRERDGQTFVDFIDANMEFVEALGPVAAERYGCPAHDLIGEWVNATIDGQPLPPPAIVHEVGLFIAGGAETTRTAISHGLRAFVDHPDQWEAMASDPSLVPGAVEEVLRWVTPLNNMFRRAGADTVLGGQPIRRGDRLILLYPSANRDESVFDDPFRFDIRRDPNPHLAFGFGTHLCAGTNVARAVLVEAFTQLSRRITDLRAVTEPDVEANIFARAVRSFHLGYRLR